MINESIPCVKYHAFGFFELRSSRPNQYSNKSNSLFTQFCRRSITSSRFFADFFFLFLPSPPQSFWWSTPKVPHCLHTERSCNVLSEWHKQDYQSIIIKYIIVIIGMENKDSELLYLSCMCTFTTHAGHMCNAIQQIGTWVAMF